MLPLSAQSRGAEIVVLMTQGPTAAVSADPYIIERRVRSFYACLCSTEPTHRCALSQNQPQGLFARTAILKLLASQAAIALEMPFCIAISSNARRR
jgi:hypothetical protein